MGGRRVGKNQHWHKEVVVTLWKTVLKNHRTTAAQVNYSKPEYSYWRFCLHKKCQTWASHPISTVGLQLLNFWLLKVMLRYVNDHKTWTSDKWECARNMVTWVVLQAVPHIRKSLLLENTQGSLQSGKPGSNSETQGRLCDRLHSNIVVWYSVGPIITLHGRITTRDYVDRLGNQMHPMIQMFLNNDAVFQVSVPINTPGIVQSWFEEHESELLTSSLASRITWF
jgi:hypothetical protein